MWNCELVNCFTFAIVWMHYVLKYKKIDVIFKKKVFDKDENYKVDKFYLKKLYNFY